MKLQQSLLPIAFLLLSVQFAFAQTKTVQESYNNIDKIELEVISGDIQIGASSDNQVRLEGQYDSDQVQVSITSSNGKLKIKEKSKARRMDEASSWTLQVPNDILIRSNTASGNVQVQGVNLELYSNTGSGNFSFENIEGRIQLNTGSGNIMVVESQANANCNTGSGNIKINGSNGNLGLNTGSGRISLDGASGSISANSGSGNVTGKNMKITGSSSFNTGSGNVSLGLAAAPDGDVSVNAGSGNSSLEMNGFKFNGELVMQCGEKNGNIRAPFSFDKEEVIERGGRNNNMIRKTKNFGSSGTKIQVSTGSGTAKVSK